MAKFRFLVKEPNNEHHYAEDGTIWEERDLHCAVDLLAALNENLAHSVIMIDIEEKERQEMK